MKSINSLLALAVAAVLAGGCVAGRYMSDYALKPEEHGNDFEGDRAKTESRYPGIIAWYDNLHGSGVFRDTTITGEGGYKLHAVFAPASKPAEACGTAVVVHGYTDNHICFLNLVRMYRDELNYNVMVPDLHYHGESEGRAIQMGWLDRLDVIRFAGLAHNIWNDDFMVIHGVSMGAATTMMVSGEELPGYIKAFVEDCGYTSVWDQFAHNLKDSFHLPPFPVLNSASIVTKNRYGWTFKEASSVKQLAKCDKPMLFIHGECDDFVPTGDVYKNFDAKTKGYKEIWIAPGSEHAMAYKDHPVEYTARVRSFLAKAKEITSRKD
ncbi:MAG: alpha/beta hydrolase [Bacteroidales bacterium]|nr:alpha/beta hydrolase [Bacteroidales bacterium]